MKKLRGNEVSEGVCMFILELIKYKFNRIEFLIYKVFLLYYLFYIMLEVLFFELEK